jgi:F-type H+-transporting ATPase subunit b
VVDSLILAQAAEEGHGNPILPEANELIYGTIAFLVLFFLLSRFVFPRVNALLEERAANIEGKLEQAERDRQEAAALLASYKEQLGNAREEATRIVEEGRRRGEEARREIIAKAESDAERLGTRAREEIQRERDRAVAEVRRDVGTLAVELAGRIIGESVDAELQQRMVDRFIDEMTGSPLSSRDEGIRS